MISTRFATVLFTLLLATGCSDDATNDGQSQGGGSGGANNGSGAGSNNGGSNNGSGAGSNNGGSNNGGSNNGGSGGEPEVTFPVCLQQCDTPADCVIPGSTQYDEDNYACNDSYCEYLGCQNDGECQTLGAEWRCGGQALGLPICVRTCSNPSDCAQGADPRFDENNYACNNSECEWLGCQSDSECQSTGQGEDWACAEVLGGVPNCVKTCDVRADCPFATNDVRFDEDNYVCDDSLCMWAGCQSDAECKAGGDDRDCVER